MNEAATDRKKGGGRDGKSTEGGGGKRKKRGPQTGGQAGGGHGHGAAADGEKRGADAVNEKDTGPLPIQEQVLQVDVNVKRIVLPKNNTVYLVNRLRSINKHMRQLRELQSLKVEVASQKHKLTKVIQKAKERRLARTSVRRYQLQKMGIIGNNSFSVGQQTATRSQNGKVVARDPTSSLNELKNIQEQIKSVPDL